MVVRGSYRATRLTGLTSRPATTMRNTGTSLIGRLGPRLMLRQLAPIAAWTPPANRINGSIEPTQDRVDGAVTRFG